MIVYRKENGSAVACQKHPFKDEFLIPANTVESAPPDFDETTQIAEFVSDKWQISTIFVEQNEDIIDDDKLPDPTPIELIRILRDNLLKESDFRMVADYSGGDQEAWKSYRQQLRELPAQIEAGKLPQPQFDQNGLLIPYPNWPKPPS
jgi:hypothetical protein